MKMVQVQFVAERLSHAEHDYTSDHDSMTGWMAKGKGHSQQTDELTVVAFSTVSLHSCRILM